MERLINLTSDNVSESASLNGFKSSSTIYLFFKFKNSIFSDRFKALEIFLSSVYFYNYSCGGM